MRTVSKEYRKNIRDDVRNGLMAEISIGLINQEAQHNAVASSLMHPLSDAKIFDRSQIQYPYATYERNFMRVDGLVMFPKPIGYASFFNGVMSNEISNSDCFIKDPVVEISFPQEVYPLDIKGLTLQFYHFYPVEFDIEWNDQKKTYVNDGLKFITSDTFDHITTPMRIIPKRMNKPHCRFRLEHVKFGIGLVFTNEELLNMNMVTYTHPISNDLPYKNLTFSIDDRSGNYDLENPVSSINYMEQMQEVKLRMGFVHPDQHVEWLDMETLNLTNWVSERNTATFKAQDTLSLMDEQYFKGQYYPTGISLYDLAIHVLNDMGMQSHQYELDSYLQTVVTKNPLPICKHKEALQIIANAGRCYMSQDADGKIYIMSNFIPDYEITSNNEMAYANLVNVKNGNVSDYYATFETGIVPVDGTIRFAPPSNSFKGNTGYISKSLSSVNGVFDTPPVVTIQALARMKTFGLSITFGLTKCTSFTVKTYRNNELQEEQEFSNSEKRFETIREWKEFDRMNIYLNAVEGEHQRAYIDEIKFGDVTDYYISNSEYIETTPRGVLNTPIKNLMISAVNYSKTETEEKLVDKDVSYLSGQEEELITFNDPVYALHCDGAIILESGTYYVKIRKPNAVTRTEGHVTVYGIKYNISTNTVQYQINPKGVDQPFENPLIDDVESAYTIAQWIAGYVGEQKDYSFNWRGDPSIESNDLIYIQNTFLPKMKLRILKNTINFDHGAFGGSIEGRKVGDVT